MFQVVTVGQLSWAWHGREHACTTTAAAAAAAAAAAVAACITSAAAATTATSATTTNTNIENSYYYDDDSCLCGILCKLSNIQHSNPDRVVGAFFEDRDSKAAPAR